MLSQNNEDDIDDAWPESSARELSDQGESMLVNDTDMSIRPVNAVKTSVSHQDF